MSQTLIKDSWTGSERRLFRFFFLFMVLFILSFPFPWQYLPDISVLIKPFSQTLVKHYINASGIDSARMAELRSDSTGLYVHTWLLLLFSFAASLVWGLVDRRAHYRSLLYWLIVLLRYYLSLQLMVYGFNKVFKAQFYFPEPNTLFTDIGMVTPDLLYWSAMGASRTFSVFLGVIEVCAALLLLFNPTRLAGALFSLMIMMQIVMINLSFDISVKLYSGFLLLSSVVILAPDMRRLLGFFFFNKAETGGLVVPRYKQKKYNLYLFIKTGIICLMLFEVLSVYFVRGNFNDDVYPRPPLHGAYEVKTFILNGDTLPPLTTNTMRWRRFFIHRRGYFIVQSMQDSMQDYVLEADTVQQTIYITHTSRKTKSLFDYDLMGSDVRLQGVIEGDTIDVKAKKTDLRKLPLSQNGIHWSVEGVKE